MRKTSITVALSVGFLAVSLALSQDGGTRTRDPEAGVWPLRLVPLRGNGEVVAVGAPSGAAVEAATDLAAGAEVHAPEGGASFDLAGAGLALQDARVRVLASEEGGVRLDLLEGELFLDDRGGPLALTITSSSATISLVGTEVGVSRAGETTVVYVESGRVSVRTPGGILDLEAHTLVRVEGSTPGAVEPCDGTPGQWRWTVGRRSALLRRCEAPIFTDTADDAPRELFRDRDGGLRAEVADARGVQVTWEEVPLDPGEVWSFRVRLRSDRTLSTDLLVFSGSGPPDYEIYVHDYGSMKRTGPLDEKWREYHLTGPVLAGLPPGRRVRPRLVFAGPAKVWVADAHWVRLAPLEDAILSEPFPDAAPGGRSRWTTLAGTWTEGGRGGMEAQAPEAAWALNLGPGLAPRDGYALGARVEPAPGGEAGLFLGMKDPSRYHAVLASMPAGARGPDRVRVLRVDSGTETVLAEAAAVGTDLGSRLFDLRVRDGRLEVYQGGRRLLQVEPFEPAGRRFGLAARGPGLHLYDDLLLRKDAGL